MKTSYTQFLIMVEFMEKNGDLSKPSGGPRGRQWCTKKWQELSSILNSEGSGDSRTEEKWRKVWSDFKNNSKKKWAKINRAARGTGGGPALKLCLTDLEERVMAIMGEQAASGLPVVEVGFDKQIESQTADDPAAPITVLAEELADERQAEEPEIELTYPSSVEQTVFMLPDDSDWNMPGSSSQPIPMRPPAPVSETEELSTLAGLQPSSPIPTTESWKPPSKKVKKKLNSNVDKYTNAFLNAEKNTRQYEKERDKMFFEIEKERIRQRDIELQMQAQWLEFMKEALNVLKGFLEVRKSDE